MKTFLTCLLIVLGASFMHTPKKIKTIPLKLEYLKADSLQQTLNIKKIQLEKIKNEIRILLITKELKPYSHGFNSITLQ